VTLLVLLVRDGLLASPRAPDQWHEQVAPSRALWVPTTPPSVVRSFEALPRAVLRRAPPANATVLIIRAHGPVDFAAAERPWHCITMHCLISCSVAQLFAVWGARIESLHITSTNMPPEAVLQAVAPLGGAVDYTFIAIGKGSAQLRAETRETLHNVTQRALI